MRCFRRVRAPLRHPGACLELAELLELGEQMIVDPVRMITQYLRATLRYLMDRPARSPDKPACAM